ncbi:hypothetical protein Tco_1468307 [Tanacetum coccineum]
MYKKERCGGSVVAGVVLKVVVWCLLQQEWRWKGDGDVMVGVGVMDAGDAATMMEEYWIPSDDGDNKLFTEVMVSWRRVHGVGYAVARNTRREQFQAPEKFERSMKMWQESGHFEKQYPPNKGQQMGGAHGRAQVIRDEISYSVDPSEVSSVRGSHNSRDSISLKVEVARLRMVVLAVGGDGGDDGEVVAVVLLGTWR